MLVVVMAVRVAVVVVVVVIAPDNRTPGPLYCNKDINSEDGVTNIRTTTTTT